MAALYLHNALFSPEPSETRPSYHSRNLSTVSGTTLHASTSDSHSQPTEPLLYPPTASTSITLDHEMSRQAPLTETLPEVTWDQVLTLEGDPYTPTEKKGLWEMGMRRRLKRLKLLKGILEVIIAIWAVYNTVMYFLAFTVYESTTGQALSLAMGMSTGIAFAFLVCATVLTIFQPRLLALHVSHRRLLLSKKILHYLSSICVLAPAIVNFVAVFVWRNTADPEMKVRNRCRGDIDVIWSAPSSGCVRSSPAWGIWLTICSVRLALTLIIIVFYHLIATSYYLTRRPSRSHRSRRRHHHHRSESYHSSLPPMAAISTSSFIPRLHRDMSMTRQASETTLASTSKQSTSQNHSRLTHSYSAGLSDEDISPDISGPYIRSPPEIAPFPVLDNSTTSSPAAAAAAVEENDRELTGFVDRFRSLVTQIARETEDGLEFAQSDSTSGHSVDPQHHGEDAEEYDEGEYYSSQSLAPVVGYNEFGQPYPPDEHVRVLNGIIRRMPTIESMGSRELASSIGASSMYSEGRNNGLGSVHTGSRPPTRNTLLSWTEFTGSEPPSRSNSLTARAELMVGIGGGNGSGSGGGTSEVGELLGAGRAGSSNTTGEESHSSTSGSRSTTMSYYTATTGSTSSTSGAVEGGYLPLHPQPVPAQIPFPPQSDSRSPTPVGVGGS